MKGENKVKSIYANIKTYMGLLLALLILCVLFTILQPKFISSSNILSVLRQIAVNAILAYGMTFVMLGAGIDLSIGSMVSLSSIFCATLIGTYGFPVYPVVLAACVIGGIVGFVNGYIVTKTGIWPFIVTLASSLIISGIAYSVSNGSPVRVLNDTFNNIGTGFIGALSLPVIYMLLLLLICYFILQRTRLGRHIYATGGNSDAARFSGINISAIRIFTYVICGIFAAFVGVFLTARMYTGQPSLGDGLVNDAIAATVVGGTSMGGGKGRIVGTLIGAILIGVISNGMNLLGISSYLQDIAKGIIILAAVMIDRASTKKLYEVG